MKFKILTILSLLCAGAFAANDVDLSDPTICATCHSDVHDEWSRSLHAFSHEDTNELYKKAISLVAKESREFEESTAISCGQCHNPKLEIKEVDDALSVALSLDLEEKGQLTDALQNNAVKNGISCYICHNVDRIIPRNEDMSITGYKRFSWTNNFITGPYDVDNESAPYHQSQKRTFFSYSDELCISCHQGLGSSSELSMYNTAGESTDQNSTKLCIDCHLGKPTEKIVAPGYPRDDAVKREIRDHFFAGARNSEILRDAIELSASKTGNSKAQVRVKNIITHKVPSGFSGRSIEINARFRNKKGEIIANKNLATLRATYLGANGTPTLSYAAKSLKEDSRLNAGETRVIDVDLPADTYIMEIKVVYYVLSPDLKAVLGVQNAEFTQPLEIINESFGM